MRDALIQLGEEESDGEKMKVDQYEESKNW